MIGKAWKPSFFHGLLVGPNADTIEGHISPSSYQYLETLSAEHNLNKKQQLHLLYIKPNAPKQQQTLEHLNKTESKLYPHLPFVPYIFGTVGYIRWFQIYRELEDEGYTSNQLNTNSSPPPLFQDG